MFSGLDAGRYFLPGKIKKNSRKFFVSSDSDIVHVATPAIRNANKHFKVEGITTGYDRKTD